MATLSCNENGRRRILFFDRHGVRRTLQLGKICQRDAETIKMHVEKIVHSQIAGEAPPVATSRWLADVNDDLRSRLARFELCESREQAPPELLGPFVEAYINGRGGVEPATKEIWERAEKNLTDFFGADKPLADITAGDIAEFWDYLLVKGRQDGGPSLESTARKRLTHANQFFLHAKKKKLIADNPVADAGISKSNLAAQEYHFVSDADAQAILAQLPGAQWKLLFALARWGGLRVGSEPRKILWDDVDWANQQFTVHAPKTKKRKPTRLVPIFPELAPLIRCMLGGSQGT
jgi:hypothetical protein